MGKFIKLTRHSNSKVIYRIRKKKIQYYCHNIPGNNVRVIINGGETLYVKETVEEIDELMEK